MQVLFSDLHSAVVLADNVWSSRQNYRPCVMVHRFCRPILSFVWHPFILILGTDTTAGFLVHRLGARPPCP